MNKFNFEIISTIAYQFEEVEIVILEKLEDITKSFNNSVNNYLVLDSSMSAVELSAHKENFNGLLLNTKLLWFCSNNVDKEIYDTSKVSNIFKKVELLSSDSPLMRKMSLIYDFVNGDGSLKTSKQDSLVPLEIAYLNNLSKSPCDIFLMISLKKYVKIINNGDDFQVSDIIQKYANKNINVFYISFSSFTHFKDQILKNLFTIDKTSEDSITRQLQITDTVLTIARDFGISDFLIEGINETFSEIDREFNHNAKLKHFLHQIASLKNTQIGTHSYLTAIFVSLIGQKFPWFTREVKRNLFIVSILHDLDIVDTGFENYEFKTIHEINKLPPKEREIIKNHPHHLSAKLAKLDVIPSDVVNIVAKHHEGAGTNSYPNGLNAPQLSPPNCLFNTAHQFAIELSNIEFNPDMSAQAIANIRAHYSGNSFKSFIDALEKIAAFN